MTCAEIKDRTVDYLYGELPARERAAFDQHLAGCDACRAEVAGLQGTLHQARAAVKMTDEAPPARVRMAVLEAAQAAAMPMAARVAPEARMAAAPARSRTTPKAEGPGFWEWMRRPWLIPLAGAAAAVAILVVAKEVIVKPTTIDLTRSVSSEASPAPAAPAVSAPKEELAPPPAAEPPAAREARREQPKTARAPARKPIAAHLDSAVRNKAGRAYAPAPPPRAQDKDLQREDDALGALSGLRDNAEGRGAAAPAGAGSGYLGGGRKSEAAADQKQAEAESSGPRELAKKKAAPQAARPAPQAPPPAPVATTAAPAPAEEKAQAPAPRQRSVQQAPAASAPSAKRDAIDELLAPPAPAKARKGGDDGVSVLQDRVEKAQQLFTASRWDEAATAYRELLRLYPDNKAAAVWKARLRTCEQAQQAQRR